MSYGFRDGLAEPSYGKEVNASLSYNEACTKLGGAIMHALNCDGAFGEER